MTARVVASGFGCEGAGAVTGLVMSQQSVGQAARRSALDTAGGAAAKNGQTGKDGLKGLAVEVLAAVDKRDALVGEACALRRASVADHGGRGGVVIGDIVE